MMKAALLNLVLVCMLGALHAGVHAQPEETGDEDQHLGRRYAESSVASEISKIMDSMVQKNFVDFLLNQRVKRSKPATGEDNGLLKLWLQEHRM